MVDEGLLQFIEHIRDHGADGRECKAKFHFVGIQLGHLSGFSDQPVEAVALLIDDGQQFLLFLGE